MRVRWLLSAVLLLCNAVFIEESAGQELFVDVETSAIRQLERYNSAYLQRVLYQARRYRIVRISIEPLLNADVVAFDPFQEGATTFLRRDGLNGPEDELFWSGRIQETPTVGIERSAASAPAMLSLHAWDIDTDGYALHSSQNRFRFSPDWKFDDSGNPVLDIGSGSTSSIESPPPVSLEEKAQHRQLLSLEKQAFYSVAGIVQMPDGRQFVFTPLRFTPRYTLIYEVDDSKTGFTRAEPLPENLDNRSNELKQREIEYQYFLDGLPPEPTQAILGDIQ